MDSLIWDPREKIAKQIVQIIRDNFGESTKVYDLFGGGGAITSELLLQGIPVHYNELNPDVRDMFLRAISLNSADISKYIISRDDFYRIKSKTVKDVDDNLKLLLNSFGDNMRDYIYGVNIWHAKYNLAKDIIANEDTFLNYQQSNTYKHSKSQPGQLNQLNKLRRLGELQQVKELKLETSSRSYEDFTNLSGQIIYLDPPYENAKGYKGEDSRKARKTPKDVYQEIRKELLEMPEGSEIVRDKIKYHMGTSSNNRGRMYEKDMVNRRNGFASEKLYDWAVKMSENNTVIVSSYEISDPRFEVVQEFKTARSTMAGGHSGIQRTEKLFMVKKNNK